LLLSTNGGRAYLFENDATGEAAQQKSLRIKLVGTKSNRDGIGSMVKLSAGGESQLEMMRSGSSYMSASELVLTFGLAQHAQADAIEIRWPSGQVDRLTNVAAGQTITVTEGKGITSSRKYGTR
jgi:enediyne biosynthesis protein E4